MDTPPSLPPKGPSDQSTATSTPVPQPVAVKPQIPLPQTFNVLPTKEILKLLDSLDTLKGYLITLMENQINDETKELDAVVKQVETYIHRLHDLNAQKVETNTRLANLQTLLQQWQTKEAEMQASLKRFSRENIYGLLAASVNESRRLTESIQDSFLNHTGKHDEATVLEFVKTYRQERKKFYMRNEKLHRFNENRVGGLS